MHRFGRQQASVDQHADGDGQVVGGAFFAHGGGGQVDHQPAARVGQADVLDRCLDALAAFLDGGIRQADNIHPAGHALPGIDFNLDDDAVQANYCAGMYGCKHRLISNVFLA